MRLSGGQGAKLWAAKATGGRWVMGGTAQACTLRAAGLVACNAASPCQQHWSSTCQHNSQQPTDEDGDEAGGGSIGASIRAVGARQGALGNHHAAQGGSEWPSGMSGVRTAEAGDAAVGWPSASSTWESLAHQESMCTAFHSARTCLFRQIVWPHPGLPAPAICPTRSLVGQGDQDSSARGVAEHDSCAPVAEGA